MSTLTVSTHTYDRITDLAHAWGTSDEGAIVRLLDFWKGASTSSHDGTDQVPIHVVYYGHRAEGIYHPNTGMIDITFGPAPEATGLKPSPAAAAVINAVNDLRGKKGTGSRNGWEFWIVTATGQPLQSIRHKLRAAVSS
jgi:hypothetical protein